MPSLVATTSALARKPCVSTHYVRTKIKLVNYHNSLELSFHSFIFSTSNSFSLCLQWLTISCSSLCFVYDLPFLRREQATYSHLHHCQASLYSECRNFPTSLSHLAAERIPSSKLRRKLTSREKSWKLLQKEK